MYFVVVGSAAALLSRLEGDGIGPHLLDHPYVAAVVGWHYKYDAVAAHAKMSVAHAAGEIVDVAQSVDWRGKTVDVYVIVARALHLYKRYLFHCAWVFCFVSGAKLPHIAHLCNIRVHD